MDWKEFFKPILGKLIIALIIVLLWPNYVHEYVIYVDGPAFYTDENGNMQPVGEEISSQYGRQEGTSQVFFGLLIILNIFNPGNMLSMANGINFIASLIVSYLIASAIIFIWQKYKTKK